MYAIAALESSHVLHEARLLVLLNAFAGDDGQGEVEGLTKLAKLDFLLRYPTYLQRALEKKGRSTKAVDLQPYERMSVESQMVRYRFGPWDHRYRKLLNLLAAKGLVRLNADARTIRVGLTEAGLASARELVTRADYADIARRSSALKTHFDMTATGLMKFIYETFPEIVSLRSEQPIPP
jgi:hypothetical protein